MRKVVAAINITLDGFCDHTAVIADEEIHDYYSQVLNNAGSILYGRITYQLMEYWRPIVKNPTGNKAMDEFAITIDKISKIVFSNTLKKLEWKTAKLATKNIKEEISQLKESPNGGSKNILVGSPGLIVALTNLNLIDEFQLCIHPIIAGSGLPLFREINNRINLKLLKTKTFACGAIVLYYNTETK